MSRHHFDRRHFLVSVASAVPAAALAGCGEAPPPAAVAGMLDRDLLLAVARAALPSELGVSGIERIAAGFESWLEAYKPLAERPHGYGTDAIENLPPSPATAWGAQLVALDTAARERFGERLITLEAARAADIVRSALAAEQIDPLPAPIEARHVAVGLLAYFYGTAEAADLCYRASIGRYACRSLASSADRPVTTEPEVGSA